MVRWACEHSIYGRSHGLDQLPDNPRYLAKQGPYARFECSHTGMLYRPKSGVIRQNARPCRARGGGAVYGDDHASPTLGELKRFLTDLQDRRGLSEHTIVAYRCDLRTLGAVRTAPLDLITTVRIEAFLTSRREKPGTTNRRIASLSRFFQWALRQGYRTDNPVDSIELKKDGVQGGRLNRCGRWAGTAALHHPPAAP